MTKFCSIISLLCFCAPTVVIAQWESLNGPPGASVRDMEKSGSAIYLVADRKLFKSTNNADSWAPLEIQSPANIDFEGITFDASGNLYGVNYSRFFKSTDAGLNWEQLNTDGDFYGIYDVQIFGPDKYFVIYGWNGVYISKDEGSSWVKVWDREPYDLKCNAAGDIFITSGNADYSEGKILRLTYPGSAGEFDGANWESVYSLAAHSGYNFRLLIDGSSRIYASVSNDIILSLNNGANWSSIKNNITDTFFGGVVWGLSPSGKVCFTNYNSSPTKFYSSDNQGATWASVTAATDSYGSNATRIVFGSATTIFLSSDGDGVFRSDNSGTAWTHKSTGLNLGNGRRVIVANNGRIIYLNNYRQKGYWTSTNSGTDWTFVGVTDFFERLTKLSDGKILRHGGPIYSSADNGTTFTKIDDTYVHTIIEDASGNLYGLTDIGVRKSVNQGDTWTALPASITGLPANFYVYYGALDASNSNLFVWVYDGSQKLFKIPTAGGAATLITENPWADDGNLNVNNVFISENKLYVAEYENLYESDDEGLTWNVISFSGPRVFPIQGGVCVSRNGSLFITQDGGKSWNSTNLPNKNATIWDIQPTTAGFIAAATGSAALKFTGELILPIDQLPPFIDFDWQPTEGPYGAPTFEVFSDNALNTYALSSGKLYKTLTFSTWQNLNVPYYLYDVVIDKPANTIYGITYNSLVKSTTGGTSWTIVNDENINCRSQLIRCTNGNFAFFACGTTGGVHISQNGGATFGEPKLVDTNDYVLRIVSTSVTSAIFVHLQNKTTGQKRIVRTTNGGTSWQEIATPITYFFQIGTDQNGNLYLWQENSLYKSSNDGDTWGNISGDLAGGYIQYDGQPFVDPSGAFLISGFQSESGKRGFWKTTNGGTNWTFHETGLLVAYSVTTVGNTIVTGTNEGVSISSDNAATFSDQSHGITINLPSDLEMVNATSLVTLQRAGYSSHVSHDFDSWTKDENFTAQEFVKKTDGSLLAYSTNALLTSPDNGVTWETLATFPTSINYLTTATGSLYFIVTYQNKIMYSNNLTSWTELNVTGLPANVYYQDIAVNDSGFIFLVLYNYSSSRTESYQILFGAAIKINQSENPRNLHYEDGKIILYDATGMILETTDGSLWTTHSAPSGQKLIIASNGYYFITQYDGTVWLSRNGGQTWQSVGMDNFAGAFLDIVINEHDGYAYGLVENNVVHKSANIVIPAETAPPVLLELTPENNATNVTAGTKLTLRFDEAVKPVAGKTIRIFDVDEQFNPVEVIDVLDGVQIGKSISFTPVTPLAYEKTYFVIVDNGAFTDIFNNSFAGINAITLWRFTIQVQPDITKPVITYSGSNAIPAFTVTGPNQLQITVTDENEGSGLNAASVKVHYRGIMSDANPTVASMTASGNNFQIAVPNGWLDELGLEFRFEASDNQGNIQYSPAEGTYHKGYISYPAEANPVLPVSVLSFGGLQSNYRVFSIPHKLADAKISTVFDELGTPDKSQYRILSFSNETNGYAEYPNLSTITRGTGYWINIRNSTDIAIEDASTPQNSKEDLFNITLKPGWNQIGNPYPFTISWNQVRTESGNASIGVLKHFNGSGFEDDDKINPFEGGFVLLAGTANVSVPISFTSKTSAGRKRDDGMDMDGGWILPITISNAQFKTTGGIGMHPEANSGFDKFDDAMPPKVFELPEIVFQHAEHFIKQFTRDVVPSQTEYAWTFTVNPGAEPGVLTWDRSSVEAFTTNLFLFDEREQKVVDMFETTQYKITSVHPSSFKIYYGMNRDQIKPTKILLGKPYPNPAAHNATVTFTLPETSSGNYHVSLDVYDILGRKVASLAQGEFTAGFYESSWSPDPAELNTGLLFYRLSASDKSSNVTLTEKIIIKK
jgi:photosystem II stability/assembly factor-like uncharacterized protein